MNREQAKLILQSYRLSGEDANDPQFTEALDLLKHDPELAEWFEEESKLDAIISEKIQSATTPPVDLKESILAGFKIVRPTPWWTKPSWISAAAVVLITLVIGAAWLKTLDIDVNVNVQKKPTAEQLLTDFRQQMVEFITTSTDHIQFANADVSEVRSWLKTKNGHEDFVVPAGLQGRPSMGCRVLSWKNQSVSFVCFEMEDKQMLHLFVVDRDVATPPSLSPNVWPAGDITTAAWDRGDKTYLMVGHMTEAELRTHL